MHHPPVIAPASVHPDFLADEKRPPDPGGDQAAHPREPAGAALDAVGMREPVDVRELTGLPELLIGGLSDGGTARGGK